MLGAIGKLRDEGVLEHQHVALALVIRHSFEHVRSEKVNRRFFVRQRAVAEESEPLHFRDLGPVGRDPEVRRKLVCEIRGIVDADQQSCQVGKCLPLEALDAICPQPTDPCHLFHGRTPAPETQRATEHDVVRIDAVRFGVRHAVAIRIALERSLGAVDANRDRPHVIEELLSGHLDDLRVAAVLAIVEAGQ